MKKIVLASLVTASIIGQTGLAHAAGAAKDGKAPGVRALQLREAAKSARAAGKSAIKGETPSSAHATELAGRLPPDAALKLGEVMDSDPKILEAVKEILSNKNAELNELNNARLEAMSNLKDIKLDATSDAIAQLDPAARNEQHYVTLATSTAKQATTWSKELRDNMTYLLSQANAHIAPPGNKSRGEALELAAKDLESKKGIKINLDDISKLCK